MAVPAPKTAKRCHPAEEAATNPAFSPVDEDLFTLIYIHLFKYTYIYII